MGPPAASGAASEMPRTVSDMPRTVSVVGGPAGTSGLAGGHSAKMHRPAAQRSSLRSSSPGLRSPRGGPAFLRMSGGVSPARLRLSVRSPNSKPQDDDSSVDLRTRSGFASEDFMSDGASLRSGSVRGFDCGPGASRATSALLSPAQRQRQEARRSRERAEVCAGVLTRRRLLEQESRLRQEQEAAVRGELRERARCLQALKRKVAAQEAALRKAQDLQEHRQRHYAVERMRQHECASIAASSSVRCASAAARCQCQQQVGCRRQQQAAARRAAEEAAQARHDRALRQEEHRRLLEERRLQEENRAAVLRRQKETDELARMHRIEVDALRAAQEESAVRRAKEDFAESLRREAEAEAEVVLEQQRLTARETARTWAQLSTPPRPSPRVRQISDQQYRQLSRGRYSGVKHVDAAPAPQAPERPPPSAPLWRPPPGS
eukprot:TRINITY_DN3185_c2_g1_i1.p1 TRINITY_DN3185_c2_g1~~TRINITY_DN3185_c2_g1_i1.p1  ORF type:complete len:461 (+),score=155.16 TRINITY_DN3185_c2_g1_i1:80-1384(+)